MSGHGYAEFTDVEGVKGQEGWNEEYKEEEESYDVDPDYLFAYDEEEHIYCEICRCSMSGPKTFEAHLAGARHKKNVKNSELGAPVRPNKADLPKIQMKDGKRVNWKPKCQAMVDSFEKPLIGLQFVTEWCHRNRFVEPRYYCSICKAKCDVRMMTSHVTGVKHRVAYMKLFYPDMAARVKEEGRKIDQAPLAEHYAKQIEEQERRQPLRVKAEGFPNCEGDEDDKELEEYILANKQNFYLHLVHQGIPTSEYWKSRGSRGHASQATRMSRSFSSMGYSGSRGFDSAGPSGYSNQPTQPSRPQMGFDSYQPQSSAISGPMSQSQPYYDEESDYRGQTSPGYSGHSSAGYSGQSGGYSGQSCSGYSGQFSDHQQDWYGEGPGFSPDRFQSDVSGMATSLRDGSAMRASHSFKPLFPSYADNSESGTSCGMRGSTSFGRPYPTRRPSRFPARGSASESHTRYQGGYF